MLLFLVTAEDTVSTIPGEVKYDRDRDALYIRCRVCAPSVLVFCSFNFLVHALISIGRAKILKKSPRVPFF